MRNSKSECTKSFSGCVVVDSSLAVEPESLIFYILNMNDLLKDIKVIESDSKAIIDSLNGKIYPP